MESLKNITVASGMKIRVMISLPLLSCTPHINLSLAPKDWEMKVSIVPLNPRQVAKIITLVSMFPIPTEAIISESEEY